MRKGDVYRSLQYSFSIGNISTEEGYSEREPTVDECTLGIVDNLHKDKEINRFSIRDLESPYELQLGDGSSVYVELIPR